MRFVVTGATSFIGTAICQYLLENGEEVIAVVRKNSKNAYKIESLLDKYPIKFIKINLDLNNVSEISAEIESADIFVHLAWIGTTKEERNSEAIQNQNILLSLNSLRTAHCLGCKLFIDAGSQSEYGEQSGELTDESAQCKPFLEYGKTKLKTYIENCRLAKQLGIRYIHLRIFSVYGEDDSVKSLISLCLDKMLRNDTINLTECSNLWNYIYIDDAAEMICKLASYHYYHRVDNEIYNIASLDTRPLRNFVEEVKLITGYKGDLNYGKIATDKKVSLNPSIYKALSVIAKSNFIPFSEGIKSIIDFKKTK